MRLALVPILLPILMAVINRAAYVQARHHLQGTRYWHPAIGVLHWATLGATIAFAASSTIALATGGDHVLAGAPDWLAATVGYPVYLWHSLAFVMFVFLSVGDLFLAGTSGWHRARAWWQNRRGLPVVPVPEMGPAHPRRRFLQHSAAALATLSGSTLSYGAVAAARPKVERREITIPHLPPPFDGFRIAQWSDIHAGPFVTAKDLQGAVTALLDEWPDVLLLTGDFVSGSWRGVIPVREAVRAVPESIPVFASLGNHERYTDTQRAMAELTAGNIRLLVNEGAVLARGGAQIAILGVDDSDTGAPDLDLAVEKIPPGLVRILMAHNPRFFFYAKAARVELTLSGHTHGGQVALPGRHPNVADLFFEHSSGHYLEDGCHLYVNRGFGTTGAPVRLNCPPEIAILTLRARGAADDVPKRTP